MKKDNIGHNNPPLDLDDFIIKDENGKRLAKRNDAKSISTFRSQGASPLDIRNMIGL